MFTVKIIAAIIFLCKVPAEVPEASYLMYQGGETVTTGNDGKGNDLTVYRINFVSGKKTRSTKIVTGKHGDIEAMGFNRDSMFFCDCGNNTFTRSTFKIFRALNSGKTQDTILQSSSVTFTSDNLNYEAMIRKGEDFFIFSKSRDTRLFLVCNQTTTEARLIDKCTLGFIVTDASISDDGKKVFLLGYCRICVLENWEGDNFFSGTKTIYNIPCGEWEGISNDKIISETKAGKPGYVAQYTLQ